MASNTKLSVGNVIKINNWHGIVMEIHCDEHGDLCIIRVQTARQPFSNSDLSMRHARSFNLRRYNRFG